MRTMLIAALSVLMLPGCMAEWKPADHPTRRAALEGHPGVSCARARPRPGMRLTEQPLCLTENGWAEYDQRQRLAGTNDVPALYPNASMAQVAPNGNPPPGPAWNPNQ